MSARRSATNTNVASARERFRIAAQRCREEVRHLPKGQKLMAYRQCMSRELRRR